MLEKVLTNVFMMIKEVIEIIAGIIVFSFPRTGVYIEARICIFCIPLILIALYPLLMNYISHIATYQGIIDNPAFRDIYAPVYGFEVKIKYNRLLY